MPKMSIQVNRKDKYIQNLLLDDMQTNKGYTSF